MKTCAPNSLSACTPTWRRGSGRTAAWRAWKRGSSPAMTCVSSPREAWRGWPDDRKCRRYGHPPEASLTAIQVQLRLLVTLPVALLVGGIPRETHSEEGHIRGDGHAQGRRPRRFDPL